MPENLDLEEFERVASRTGVFKGVEIDLLHETLLSWKSSQGDPYTLLELRDGKALAAFALIGRISGRESTFDIRYIVLDRDYRTAQVGKRILEMIDADLLKKGSYAVIRLETSTSKVGNAGAAIYEEGGYKVIGHIAGYYGEYDDYYYLMKTLYRNPPQFSTPPISPPAGSSDDEEQKTETA